MCQPLFSDIHEVEDLIQRAPHLLLCLDYDGTLTHFTATPLGAHLSPQMERSLLALAEHPHLTLAIVSGRDRADLQARVGIPGLIYAGNHGLDISGPGFVFVEPTAASQVEALQELAGQLTTALQQVTGALVEFKGLTLSVHYRLVPPEQWDNVRSLVHSVLAKATHPFVLATGEKVFEVRPRVYWHKGTAMGWIKEKLGKPEILSIYVGDDTTDEDAFASMQDGITIRVGHSPTTAARYTLESPAEVRKFLEWVEEVLRHKELQHDSADSGQEAREVAVH